VVPSVSIRADFPVAVVDRVVDRHGTRKAATAYLQFLFSDTGQEILAKNFFRVRNSAIAGRYKSQFPEVRLVTIEGAFGGWDQVMKVHFGDGGFLDQAFVANR
jgi:ABC-type sulfate transport system substrate-binding protein